jgi:predicted enzyme related to lactoylglutathione lyase
MKNAINWFEIPAVDFARSVKFYSAILSTEMPQMEMGGCMMAFFPCDRETVGGAVVSGNGYKPSAEGSIVYLNGGDDLSEVLSRVEAAGGKVLLPKTLIREDIGYWAFFLDTEGNKVGLHSIK